MIALQMALGAATLYGVWRLRRWVTVTRSLRLDNPLSPTVRMNGAGAPELVVPLSRDRRTAGAELVILGQAMEGAGHYRTAGTLYALASDCTADETALRGARRCERLLSMPVIPWGAQ